MHSLKPKATTSEEDPETIIQSKLSDLSDWVTDKWYDYAPDLLKYTKRNIRRMCWDVRDYFFPSQKWLTSVIPRHFSDKVSLIPLLLYTCVIHFVEGEKCFEHTDWAGSFEGGAQFELDLKAAYSWAKVGRAEFQKRIDAAYPELGPIDFDNWFTNKEERNGQVYYTMKTCEERTGKDYQTLYGPLLELEKEFKEIDTKWLTWIVSHKEFMWT